MAENEIKIRALRADEIEVRVGQVMKKGVSLLLYKDARCDKRILDETFGVMGWANAYAEIKGNLYCSIMLYDKNSGMWIQKSDVGVESNTEKEKGEASDAFKRAGFNIGIGRELYTKIFIFIETETTEIPNTNGKYKLVDPYQKWHVAKIQTNEEKEKIEFLQIADKNNKIVFTFGTESKTKKKEETKKEEPVEETITKEQRKELFTKANNNSDVVKNVLSRFGYENTEKIKVSDYEKICNEIENELTIQ